MANQLLAQISRAFLVEQRVYRYRMKKIGDMDDEAVIRACHCFCEENHLTHEFKQFREGMETEHFRAPMD